LIAEAQGLANVVKDYQLNTSVLTYCHSACSLVFISGKQRDLGKNAQLGFHQYEVYSKAPLPWIEPIAEQRKDLAYFKEKNVAAWFLDKIYTTEPPDIWIPSQRTLIAARVITHYQISQ